MTDAGEEALKSSASAVRTWSPFIHLRFVLLSMSVPICTYSCCASPCRRQDCVCARSLNVVQMIGAQALGAGSGPVKVLWPVAVTPHSMICGLLLLLSFGSVELRRVSTLIASAHALALTLIDRV